MAIGATKFGCLLVFLLLAVTTFFTNARPEKRQNLERDEYEDVPDKPFPGKVQIMPIVQRDTKSHKDVSETVEEIIRELPNDEQYERIGKMLNNSYDAITREVAEGNTAYQQKMVMAEKTNSALNMGLMTVMMIIGLITFMIL